MTSSAFVESVFLQARNVRLLPYRLQARWRLLFFRRAGWHKTRDGFWMQLDPDQYIDRAIIRNKGVWEPATRSLLQACLKPGDAFIDIGGHKGYFSCVAAQIVGRTGAVLSFEPDPRVFDALAENVRRNGFFQITPIETALAAHEGTLALSLTRNFGNTSSFPNRIAAQEVVKRIVVPCGTLDRLVASKPGRLGSRDVPLIKIDAEGAEPLIWQGMQNLVARYRPLVALEINYGAFEASRQSVAEFQEALARAGYVDLYEYSADGLRHSLALRRIDIVRERRSRVDVLAVPAGSDRFAPLEPAVS